MDCRAQPDEKDEIRLRMLNQQPRSKVAMREIEIAALNREIASPVTSSKRRAEATERRDA
jgi:hypothetical protein